MFSKIYRRTLLTGLVVLALEMPVIGFAQSQAAGLGQSWPNAPDVSANSNWHVYVFELKGIRFIQVNDINGNVLGAVGTANGQFITLPMGVFAQYVTTPRQSGTLTPNNLYSASLVYQDMSVLITARPMSNGATQLTASPAPCQNPEDCGQHLN
ncbi:hypothetical protein U0F71_05410 [Burkholderia pseudomallei]|uniref:hypothetical protein n=1 Tax=Burkholderia pseudomallei TaxID=28450 RepID=UPI002AB41891|nr:hypothetical protein [Burkholderia pseudomallei]MDY7815156.1 hypothetical protein [Burkholderia pseudomallei]MDY7861717.1 hypothetical protein [Burkholderia pseudomallei]